MNIFLTIPLFLAILFSYNNQQAIIEYNSSPVNRSIALKTNIISSNNYFDYQDYAFILKEYVNDLGLVNYNQLQINRGKLDNFNRSIGEVTPETYNSWNKEQQLAFLINAYNSFTLQSIIDRQPLPTSIRKIPGVWKIRKFKIAGQLKTLDNIEHDIIRKQFNEPRIHVALVCAAISCPPLSNQPYLGQSLDQQLNDRFIEFINSDRGLKIDKNNNTVYLSSIFKWFGKDWVNKNITINNFTGNKNEKAVLNYIAPYLSPEDSNYLERGEYNIKYLNYDWSLNKQN